MTNSTEEEPKRFATGGYIEGHKSDSLVPAGYLGCIYPAHLVKDYKLSAELLEWVNNTHHKENE